MNSLIADKLPSCPLVSLDLGGGEGRHAAGVGSSGQLIIRPAAGDSNAIFADGHRPTATAVETTGGVSGTAWLAAPTPNPADGSTVLRFNLPSEQAMRLMVYDAAGRRLRSLAEGTLGAGTHSVSWDGRDESGSAIASGIYFVRLTVGGETFTKGVVVRQ